MALSGFLTERGARRYSPAGIPFTSGNIHHESEVLENGVARKVELDLNVLAAGEWAFRLESLPLGEKVIFHGFLSPIKKQQKRLVLHIQSIEFF